MRKSYIFRENHLVAAVLCGGILLAGCFYLFINHSVDRWVHTDAENEALSWAQSFSSQLTDLDTITSGGEPSAQSRRFIETASNMGRVFRFKLFDGAGGLRLVSDALDQKIENDGIKLVEHNPKAASVISTGNPRTFVKEGTPPKRPPLYAESYLPVVVDGKTVAVVEVYVDQTEKAAEFRKELTWTVIWLTAFGALSFLMPYSAFMLRNRQKNRADARLQFMAHHDPMTHALNRTAFVDRLQQAMRASSNLGESIAVHYIDLDHFKAVNDTLGHGVGDALIRAFVKRARDTIKSADLIGRFGGDEFVISQSGISGKGQATKVAERLVAKLSEPYVLDGHDIAITLSIGCAISPRDGDNADELLQRADLALYYVKSSGRNGHAFYRPNMSDELKARRNLEARLKRATQEDSFDLHFQPVVNSDGSSVTGFEALLRLPDDGGEYISPEVFVPLAENMGLLPQIGAWVLRKACETAQTWPESYTIAVNLSPAQFAGNDVAQMVARTLEETGLAPKRLELEITEGLVMSDTESVSRQLKELKELGVAIVMDDFGTGYSSLSYLWRFPFDKIKIDRSFMQAFENSDDNVESILETIVSLGHSLKMRVTAEGVETPEQAAFMEKVSCDQIQGFLYGRPMTETDIAVSILENISKAAARDTATATDPKDGTRKTKAS